MSEPTTPDREPAGEDPISGVDFVDSDFRDVPVTDIGHPLADRVGTTDDGVDWVATESRSRIVHLNPMRVNFLTTAIRDGRRPVLITDELTRLTPAFNRTWRLGGGHWVVRETTGGLRNGFDGRRLDDITDVWLRPAPQELDDIAVNHLRPLPTQTLQLTAMVATRHPARDSTVLGGSLEQVSAALDHQPWVWGLNEPASSPWDRDALTRVIREQMPDEASAFVAGPGMNATITAQRTQHGVEEMVHAGFTLGWPDEEAFSRIRSKLSAVLRRLAETQMPLISLLVTRPGPVDLLVPPALSAPPIPLTLLLGAPAVRAFGLDVAQLRERFGAEAVGRPRIPALLFDLGALEPQAWLRLDAILTALGPQLLEEVLGQAGSGLRAAQFDRPVGRDQPDHEPDHDHRGGNRGDDQDEEGGDRE